MSAKTLHARGCTQRRRSLRARHCRVRSCEFGNPGKPSYPPAASCGSCSSSTRRSCRRATCLTSRVDSSLRKDRSAPDRSDYSRRLSQRFLQFGSGANLAPWRDLLAGTGRAHLGGTRKALGDLLDAVAERRCDVRSALKSFTDQWLDAVVDADGLDWRWYFVKYPAMREGRSGIYVGANGALGYLVCMLDRSQMNSWYRDPYLSAIQRETCARACLGRRI